MNALTTFRFSKTYGFETDRQQKRRVRFVIRGGKKKKKILLRSEIVRQHFDYERLLKKRRVFFSICTDVRLCVVINPLLGDN